MSLAPSDRRTENKSWHGFTASPWSHSSAEARGRLFLVPQGSGPAGSHCCRLPLPPGDGDPREQSKGKRWGISPILGALGVLSRSLSQNYRASPGLLSVSSPCPPTVLWGSGLGRTGGESHGKLTGRFVVFCIPLFPNLPATVYFSESSNSCSVQSRQVL